MPSAKETAQKQALHAFAKVELIPMGMTLIEGVRLYVQRRTHDSAHASRTVERLLYQEIATTEEGIRKQIDTAIEETKD